MLQAVLAAGATDVLVIGTSRDALRLDVARALGAHAIDVDAVEAVLEVQRRTGGNGADIVFDVSPAPATVPMSLALVRAGGTVLLAGLKENRPVEIVTDQIVNRSLHVIGGTAFSQPSLEAAVRALNDGTVDTKPLRGPCSISTTSKTPSMCCCAATRPKTRCGSLYVTHTEEA